MCCLCLYIAKLGHSVWSIINRCYSCKLCPLVTLKTSCLWLRSFLVYFYMSWLNSDVVIPVAVKVFEGIRPRVWWLWSMNNRATSTSKVRVWVLNAVVCGGCVTCQCLLSTVHSAPVQGGTSDNNCSRDTKNKPVKCCLAAQVARRSRSAPVSFHGSASWGVLAVGTLVICIVYISFTYMLRFYAFGSLQDGWWQRRLGHVRPSVHVFIHTCVQRASRWNFAVWGTRGW